MFRRFTPTPERQTNDESAEERERTNDFVKNMREDMRKKKERDREDERMGERERGGGLRKKEQNTRIHTKSTNNLMNLFII